jgi:hypothetical protein
VSDAFLPTLVLLFPVWAIGGVALALHAWGWVRARNGTNRAAWFAAVLVFPFALLLLPVVLYHTALFVLGAGSDLYRTFFPKKIRLPEARVRQ